MVFSLDLSGTVGRVVSIILGVVVTVVVLGALVTTFFDNLNDLVGAMAATDAPNNTGDATADTIKQNVFPIVIALSGLFLFAGLALNALRR